MTDAGGMRAAAERDQQEWDERYAADGHDTAMWSGQPNGALVDELADMPAGTALEVGCGEGADAVWLAERGWTVTALDPSAVALRRAAAAAARAGVEVAWTRSGLAELDPGGRYDLVTAMYPAVRHGGTDQAARALLDAVAPGGTLLFVHHDMAGHDHARERNHGPRHGDVPVHGDAPVHDNAPSHGDAPDHDHEPFDPGDYVQPADVRALLDDRFVVEVDEVRPRSGPLPPDARRVPDIVLRVRRRP